MPKLACTLLAAVLVMAASAAPAHASGAFLETCAITAHAQEDPILNSGPGQSAHDHNVAGNRAWDGDATTTEMLAGQSGCDATADKFSGWTPTLVSPLGQTVVASKMVYDLRNDQVGSDVIVPPNMFAYIKRGPALWKCIGAPSSTQKFTIPTNCDAYGNQGVAAANYFTNENICWDGVNVGPGFHRTTGPADATSHVTGHLAADGSCPAPNKRIPGNGWHMTFPGAGAVGARLSSDGPLDDPGDSWHVDHVQVNRSFVVAIAADCLNAEQVPTTPLTITCTTRPDGHVYRKSDGKLVI